MLKNARHRLTFTFFPVSSREITRLVKLTKERERVAMSEQLRGRGGGRKEERGEKKRRREEERGGRRREEGEKREEEGMAFSPPGSTVNPRQ